jgi:rubrerythrin
MLSTMVESGNETTIKNLLAAYQGETNVNARYKAYAKKADADGLPGVASLFRATARAEQVHANNQSRVLRQLGGEARAEVLAFKVQATLDNLKSALAGEKYEIESMYPAFITEAMAHIHATAARAFTWALEAEKTHVRLYNKTIAAVESGQSDSWVRSPRDFYVCPVCACTSEEREPMNCPICQYPSDRLETVS